MTASVPTVYLRRLEARVSSLERFKGWRVRYEHIRGGGSPNEKRGTGLMRSRCEADEWIRRWSKAITVSHIRVMRVYRKDKR